MRWAAVVLTGGTGSRLGGADKAALVHDGRTLLDRALDATAGAVETVVVGPEVETGRRVTFAREDPPGGGPLAGLRAGVTALAHDVELVVVLAVDLPHVRPSTVSRLLTAAAAHPSRSAWLAGADGRWTLAAALPPGAVTRLGDVRDRPVRALVESLAPAVVPAHGAEADDVDTWDDVRRLLGPGAAAADPGEAT